MKKIFVRFPLSENIILPSDITHHLLHVFRFDIKNTLLVSGNDGKTGLYKITDASGEEAKASLIEYIDFTSENRRGKNGYTEVVLVQSFLKNDKFEWVLQKGSELDVHTIYGVQTQNSVVRFDEKKLAQKECRWQKIVLEASQQCGREQLPKLILGKDLKTILQEEKESLCLLASEDELKLSLKDVLVNQEEISRIVIFIGPEGSFSKKEIDLFKERNIPFVTLGSTILRAETAAISAVSMINYVCKL